MSLRSYIGKDEQVKVVRETRLSDFIDFEVERARGVTARQDSTKQNKTK